MTKIDLALPADYADWLASLKQRIAGAQQRATVAVNTELGPGSNAGNKFDEMK